MVLSRQFDAYSDIRSVPEPFGTVPVPRGSVRVNHYTSDESVPGIQAEGLKMGKAHESFARGTTEFPSIFASAGAPTEHLIRSRPVVEAHIPVSSLDVGGLYGRPTIEQQEEQAKNLEGYKGTVTTNTDLPKENIIAVHHPWHQTFRYLQNDPTSEHEVMSGFYDSNSDEDLQRALAATKLALAAKVMVGGSLGRRGSSSQ